ncbi:M23 family metallopeptidase [Agromyces sp. NPDC058136]|uniref:M23 family metallopeptidase n=1 Tax=Agromyces sp. NPDC058136 TaxID=3346354 RepID=UPI0036D7B594
MAASAALAVSVSLPALAVDPRANSAAPFAAATPAGAEVLAGSAQHASAGTDVVAPPLTDESYTTGRARTTGWYAQTASTFVNYSGPIQWPFRVGVPISSDFGPRVAPCAGCSTYHKGLDMNPGDRSPIQAIAAGVVREASAVDNGGLGVYAVIDHTVGGELVSSVYAHMAEGSLEFAVGDEVAVGDQVGLVGNTGQSTGPHLHLEILEGGTRPVDPYDWLSERVAP